MTRVSDFAHRSTLRRYDHGRSSHSQADEQDLLRQAPTTSFKVKDRVSRVSRSNGFPATLVIPSLQTSSLLPPYAAASYPPDKQDTGGRCTEREPCRGLRFDISTEPAYGTRSHSSLEKLVSQAVIRAHRSPPLILRHPAPPPYIP
jgi:hypothetical protein